MCCKHHLIQAKGTFALLFAGWEGPLGCYGDQLAIILLKVGAWRGNPSLLP